jgi:hypothetical protein
LAFSSGNRSLGAVERRREPEGLCFSLTRPERRAERNRLTSLIQASSNLAPLIVCAPIGSGKTAALMHYAGRSNGCYLNVRGLLARSGSDAQCAFDDLPAYADLIVIDDFDIAPPEAIDALFDRIAAGTDGRRYIVAGRSRQRMRVSRALALGRASLLDGSALAFDRDEMAQLADRYRLRYDDEDLAQLLHDTDGWPIAIHWIMRDALRSGERLRGAFESWRDSHGHLLAEFATSEYERDIDEYLRFTMLLRRGFEGAEPALERFEALGFPVVRTRSALRPNRVLSRLANAETDFATKADRPAQPTMSITVLGRFRCEIGRRKVVFARRRDQNVLIFVALAPNGRATRRQLLEAFWPDVDRESAKQGLRTTLSRIRRAIGEVVGAELVDVYLRSTEDICIDNEHVTSDLRRFDENHALGQLEESRGELSAAKRYYAAADRLYADRLLASEAVEPCFAPRVGELEATYVAILSRLVALHMADSEREAARAWTSKLMRRGALPAAPETNIERTGARVVAFG